MKILHIVKTSDGADWAAAQAAELTKLGAEVHVALPSSSGRVVPKWARAGAILHVVPTDLPIRKPAAYPSIATKISELVSSLRPDLIHSHFFGSTILLRLALGRSHPIPRVFQVPGPLHLEHRLWRTLDLKTAGPRDCWIASSRCILSHYQTAGVESRRLFLSYYGTTIQDFPRTGLLRARFGIPPNTKIVGNANFIYPPKWFLGQTIGLKAHEDVIDALASVVRARQDVMGVLVGGTFAGSKWYEEKLNRRALQKGSGRILMPGYVPMEDIRKMWPDFDVAVHVPTSENCGGVVEPLLASVPTIAGRVGGLPEVVIDEITGQLVPIRQPESLSRAILNVLDNPGQYRRLATSGNSLIQTMFNVERTASEIFKIYAHLLDNSKAQPSHFDSEAFARSLAPKLSLTNSQAS